MQRRLPRSSGTGNDRGTEPVKYSLYMTSCHMRHTVRSPFQDFGHQSDVRVPAADVWSGRKDKVVSECLTRNRKASLGIPTGGRQYEVLRDSRTSFGYNRVARPWTVAPSMSSAHGDCCTLGRVARM